MAIIVKRSWRRAALSVLYPNFTRNQRVSITSFSQSDLMASLSIPVGRAADQPLLDHQEDGSAK